MCQNCDPDINGLDDDEDLFEKEEYLTPDQSLQQATRTLMVAAKPATRKRIVACLESCTLGSGTIYDDTSGAVCLMGTAIPKSRRQEYDQDSVIVYEDWNRWFTESYYLVDQQPIYRVWDSYVCSYGIDRARQIAIEEATRLLTELNI